MAETVDASPPAPTGIKKFLAPVLGFLKRYKGPIQYVIGFALLAYVIQSNWNGKQPPAPEPDAPLPPPLPGLKDLMGQTPDFVMLGLAAFCIFAATVLQFYRWYLLVRALDLKFTFRDAVRLGMVGFFYNTFLPGSVGGDAVKAYFLIRDQPTRRAAAFATVVADRLFGLFGLILYVAVVGGALWASGDEKLGMNPDLQRIITICGTVVVVAVVVWLMLGLLPQSRADRFATRLQKVPKVGKMFAELWSTVVMYRKRSLTVLACLGLSAITHTCYVLIFHFAVQVFPGDVASFSEHVAVAPLGYIMEALFPAPGGVGGGEWIFGNLYLMLKKPLNVGVVGRLTMRMIQWSFGLIGYIAYLRMKTELPVEVKEPAEEKPSTDKV